MLEVREQVLCVRYSDLILTAIWQSREVLNVKLADKTLIYYYCTLPILRSIMTLGTGSISDLNVREVL